jgi:predicted RNA-binding Zn-ribbon protein involved in translation (DUF1610 family)
MKEVIKLGADSTNPATNHSTSATVANDRIRVNCPECGARVKAKFGQEGKPFHCPFCSKISSVPIPHQAIFQVSTAESGLRRAALWGAFLMLLGITYWQQRLWMPLVGLRPPPGVEKAISFK